MGRAVAFGLAAAIPVALVYGVLADPFGLSLGLIVVGLIGGYFIGLAMARGAYDGRFHLRVRNLELAAIGVSVVAWLLAIVVAYVGSQLFYQGATTPLLERVSVGGFIDYLGGSIFSPTVLGLFAMAFTAWRGAR